jgi:uncharacterized membrane protein
MSHAHSHHPPSRPTDPARARRITLLLLVPAVVLTAIGMALLWPGDVPNPSSADGPTRLDGEVVAVAAAACPEPPEGQPEQPGPPARCGTVTVRLADGAQVTTNVPTGPGAIEVAPGDGVVLIRLDNSGGPEYSIIDHQRSTELWLLGAVFALAVIAFGRWRGLSALAGLGVTFAVLLWFVVPAILDGGSPLAVAIVGAAAIMLSVLYLTHGFNLTTTVAVAGTLVSLTITAALSAVVTAATHLSGVADDTASFLNVTQGEVNMRGLLLAGIVIGSLGVLDDVTVTQSATVTELAAANPGYGLRRLYGAATRIGRAHVASVINTIVLAYAGASLPLLLLFASGGTPVGELLSGELIAQEMVRSAVGTIGLIAAVPVTTGLAAFLATRGASPAGASAADGPRPVAPVAGGPPPYPPSGARRPSHRA